MVAAGTFREDLFYRLAVVPILVPPLRDRPGDTARLVRHFAALFADRVGRPGVRIEDDAVDLLATQPWPGNVRQLQNFLERLVVLSGDAVLSRADVARELARGKRPTTPPASSTSSSLSLDEQRRATEKEALLQALKQSGNNRTDAARILGVSRRTLYNKLRDHGVD
jgi:two-component system response regulator AtoC